MPSVARGRDGSVLRWGDADTPGPPAVVAPGAPVSVAVAVSPVQPGHAVTVEYRVNEGPVCQAIGLPQARGNNATAHMFRAVLPGQADGLVEFLPVLRFVGQPISPRLTELAVCPRYQVGCGPTPVETETLSAAASTKLAGGPSWDWSTKFLGSVRVGLRMEVVGVVPDGLRINWHVTEGSFVGAGLDARVLPGATDWMRIRKDGVGVVNVNACIETRSGSRIYTSYGGTFDLGPEGYERALRNKFDPLPPFVVTPTYATSDAQFAWLNRAQCIGVGRVDMKAMRVEYDVYVIQVGARKNAD